LEAPGGLPNLVRIIVSITTSYIVSFKFLRQAVQKWPFFWAGLLDRSPLTWGLKKAKSKQPIRGLTFHQLSDFYIKRSRRS